MDRIFIKKLEVFAKHGVFPEENVLGQKREKLVFAYGDILIADYEGVWI